MITKEEMQAFLQENFQAELEARGFRPDKAHPLCWYRIVKHEVLLSVLFAVRKSEFRIFFGFAPLCASDAPIPFRNSDWHSGNFQDGSTSFFALQLCHLKAEAEGAQIWERQRYYGNMLAPDACPSTLRECRQIFSYLIWPLFDRITDAQSCCAIWTDCQVRYRKTRPVGMRAFEELAYLGDYGACAEILENWKQPVMVQGIPQRNPKLQAASDSGLLEAMASREAFEVYREALRKRTVKGEKRILSRLIGKSSEKDRKDLKYADL